MTPELREEIHAVVDARIQEVMTSMSFMKNLDAAFIRTVELTVDERMRSPLMAANINMQFSKGNAQFRIAVRECVQAAFDHYRNNGHPYV